ncbi:MAG: methyltransferase [archaeon]
MSSQSETPLTEEHLALMNEDQRRIVTTQWQRHQHETHEADYDVSGEGDLLKGFVVGKGVWDPFLASGRYHARQLFYNNHLFNGKTAIEIGSGTGLMSVVMAKHGASKVIASDISWQSFINTDTNVKKFGLRDKVDVVQGDLFENIHRKADLIAWMIPFFPGNTPKGDRISASMIMPPELFERFLVDAKDYLNPNGVVLVPSYSLGGELMDPMKVAPRFGYDVKRTWTHDSTTGIQQGLLYMDELRVRE